MEQDVAAAGGKADVDIAIERGWSLTPLNGKKPVLKDWTKLHRPTPEEMRAWARQGNVGLRTGAISGVFVIDVDEGGDVSSLNLPDTTVVETGRGQRHYYFAAPNPCPGNSAGRLGPHVDTRGEGGQVVFPGSIHPDTGKPYRFLKLTDLAPLPLNILAALTDRPPTNGAAVTGPVFIQGSRNSKLASLAGSMRRAGFDTPAITAALLAQNATRCSPPLDTAEVHSIANSVARYQPQAPSAVIGDPMDLADVISRPAESVDWIVPHLLASGDLVIMASEPGVGKSWAAADLSFAMAQGDIFLSCLELNGGPRRVLYVDLENGPKLARWRLQRLCYARGITADKSSSVPLHYVVQDFLNLAEPAGRDALESKIETWRPAVVIFDTLKRLHRYNENDNSEMSCFFADAIRPLLMQYGCTVILLHHLRKTSGIGGEDLLSRVRGAGDIVGVADQVWGLRRDGENSFTLSHLKHRWAKPAADLAVTIEDTDSDCKGVLLLAKETTKAVSAVFDRFLREQDTVSRQDIIAALVSAGLSESAAAKGVTREADRREARGTIRKTGNKRGVTYEKGH